MSYLVDQQYGPVSTGLIPSMYENLTTLGFSEEQKQHFVEWFSGDSLDSIWTFTDHAGTGSGAMNDAVDGGYRITTGATTDNNSSINFNDINQYSHNASVFEVVIRRNTTFTQSQSGLAEQIASLADTWIAYRDDTSSSFKELQTKLNSSTTNVDSTVSIDTDLTRVRLETKASSALMWIAGSLECISTTNLPDVALQPFVRSYTRNSSASTTDITYLEVYNT